MLKSVVLTLCRVLALFHLSYRAMCWLQAICWHFFSLLIVQHQARWTVWKNTSEPNPATTSFCVLFWAASSILEPTLDQYKSYTFATVKQRTTRVIGKGLIEKLFSLDHRFHSNRETGALLKAVDRGNRAISTVLHAACIVFAPAMFQVTP